ncbi:MAG: response regulator [Deltaproteobacteria bacterium]|nr:response regulator [Deltaproteobacteria bacterium]
MDPKKILVLDDEKNICLTLSQALGSEGLAVQTAADGEAALSLLKTSPFDLVLLDLKLPGIDGLEVLRRLRSSHSRTPVIMITAHGNIESAVEAMKLGALDFLRKPFGVDEVRYLVNRVLARQIPEGETPVDYQTLIEKAGKGIREGTFEAAGETARRAIALDPGRPEAYNLLGALLEIKHDRLEAQKFYRAALEIDPTYRPAGANLERITLRRRLDPVDLGSTV